LHFFEKNNQKICKIDLHVIILQMKSVEKAIATRQFALKNMPNDGSKPRGTLIKHRQKQQ
jgi:hypothetical protein